MKVPLFAVEKLSREVRAESLAAFERVFDSGTYILGAEVTEFESDFGARWGSDYHAVGVSNGTDALVCALASVGVTSGQRVLTSPLTFFATISAIQRLGAIPVFCDVDSESFNLDVSAREVATIDAVVPVHLFGRPVDVPRIRHELPNVPVVEDAAQALGATLELKQVGMLGDLAAFSFFPTKPLGGCGDGGAVVTRDAQLAARCRAIRSHGRAGDDGTFVFSGGNYRLDAVQAALLRVRLARIDEWQRRRRLNAEYYIRALGDLSDVVLPACDSNGSVSAWSVFSLRVPEVRDALRAHLTTRGVGTAVYYPRAAHLQPALGKHIGRVGQYPIAERLTRELLALPVGPELSTQDRDYVVGCVRSFFARSRGAHGSIDNGRRDPKRSGDFQE